MNCCLVLGTVTISRNLLSRRYPQQIETNGHRKALWISRSYPALVARTNKTAQLLFLFPQTHELKNTVFGFLEATIVPLHWTLFGLLHQKRGKNIVGPLYLCICVRDNTSLDISSRFSSSWSYACWLDSKINFSKGKLVGPPCMYSSCIAFSCQRLYI